MQFSRKGKKDQSESTSRAEEGNVSIHSGMNVDSYRRGPETRGRPGQYPEFEKSTTESGYREVLFVDPSDNLRRHQSPITEGKQTFGNIKSNQPQTRQSVLSSVRNDLNERQDTAQIVGKKPISHLTMTIPFRKEETDANVERNERSPKVINLAGGFGEPEFNTKSYNLRRSPTDSQKINYQYGTHTMTIGENPGNLLLDQPVNVLGSFIQGNENIYNSVNMNYPNQGMQKANNSLMKSGENQMRDPRERDREINFGDKNVNNSRGEIQFQGGNRGQNLKSKMSPNRNVEEREIYLDKHLENDENRNEKIQDLKRINRLIQNQNDAGNEPIRKGSNAYDRPYETYQGDNIMKNYGSDIENLIKMKQVRNLNRQVTGGFGPQKKEGRLVTGDTHVMNPINDQLFPDRRTVLLKMNKLSHILMSKSRSLEPLNRSVNEDLNSSTYNRQTLRQSQDSSPRKSYALSRSPQQKFIRVTMAMLSSKGPNCEDRIITRIMRFEKGGVVDLAQKIPSNKKYEVKKVRRTGEKGNQAAIRRFNPKDRERASKIVQAWWREILNKYKNLTSKILKIQSVWRGHWLRTYLYEIVYSGIIIQNFIDRLKAPLVRNVRRPTMERLLELVPEVNAKQYLSVILKLQRNIKLFLMRMRNKAFRLPIKLSKIFERKRRNTMEALKNHAMGADMRIKKRLDRIMNLLNKVKRAMRVRIFHDFLFKVFNRPVNQLKSAIFRNMLRNNITKFGKILLRQWFTNWMKNSLKSSFAPELKKRAANQLYKTILKNRFNDLVSKQRKLPPKGLKSKLLKRLVKNADKYSDIFLRDCLLRWFDMTKKLKILDFKNELLGRFLFKTSRRLEQNNLKRRFRKWAYQQKSGKDLVPYVDGWDHLCNHVRRRMYDQVMPVNSVNGIKNRLLKSIFRKSHLFKLVPLRHYWNKWKKVCSKERRLEISGMVVRSLGRKIFDKNINALLLRRFLDWKRKNEMLKYLERIRNNDTDKRKYYGLIKLMSGTEKLAKRQALKTALPPITRYLDYLLRQLGVKRLLMMNPRMNRILKKNYWNKWMDQIKLLRKREVRDHFFESLMKKTGSRFRKNVLRRFLTKWYRNLPKNLEIRYYNGAEMLQRALWRRNKRNPIDAFKNKIELENAKNGIQRAFGLKNKYIQRHWRDYLLKWKKNTDKLKLKEMKNELCAKLFATLLNKFRNRILSNRFSHWRKVPKINMKDIFNRFKHMTNFAQTVVNKILRPTKKNFLLKAKNHKGNKAYNKALRTLANLAINGKLLKLRHYFDNWRRLVKDFEIHDLKLKLLRSSVGQEGFKNRKKSLASAFHRWIRNVKLEGLLRHSDKNLIIYKAINLLNGLIQRRMNDFMTRLKRLMNLDSRGRLLLQMYKRVQRPRVSLSRAFDRWRRINDIHNRKILSQNYITRLLDKSCAKVSRRILRDNYLKSFNKWKSVIRKPDDYYLRIANGVMNLDSFF